MFESWQHVPRWLRLSLSFPLFFLNGWLLFILIGYLEPLGTILTTATLFAFLLNFPIRLLEQRGLKRGWATALVFLLALIIIAVLGLILIPIIITQLTEFLKNLPQWLDSGNEQFNYLKKWAISHKIPLDVQQVVTQLADKFSSLLNSLGNQVLEVVTGTIGTILNILFVFVLTIFLVLTGEDIWRGLLSWIPTPWDERIQVSLKQTFEKYFATQGILAIILSIAQTMVFGILQIPYALLFGLTIGLTTLIPYASALTIIIISAFLMFQNFQLGLTALILTIVVGQINDNILAPKLVGGMTGLNPFWIIIALFIGGKIAGILGLLIAVPFTSVLKTNIDILRYSPELKEPDN
ncbi:AI-2E family transporter [Crocosphaera sp. Alani8]|uniref:AI-2E family transporter n=1 Tax=Crocosphaera sp. Alani8 TaxID=3038952 RepID=UPI00313D3226